MKDSGHIHSVFREGGGPICLCAYLPFGTERSPSNRHEQLDMGTAASAHRSPTAHELQLPPSYPATNDHPAKTPLLSANYKINLNKHKIKAIKQNCWTNGRRDEIKA